MAAAQPKSWHKNIWPAVAIASLTVNVGLVVTYVYLLNYNQYPLLTAEVAHRCVEPYYSRLMKSIDEKQANKERAEGNKKYAAAALCFIDWETGRVIDTDSIKPLRESTPQLPARP